MPDPSSNFLYPLRSPRLWVAVLWSLTLAVALAAWDWAERRFEDEAAARRIVLLPAVAPDAAARAETLAKITAEPGIASAEWIAPADLTRRIAQLFPSPSGAIFSPDEPWLTWVLEVRPRSPLDNSLHIDTFTAQRRGETGRWRMVLWDSTEIQELNRARAALRAVAGFFALIAALAGAAALACLPPPRSRGPLAFWSGLLGTLAPAAVWGAALLGGIEADARSLALAAAAGFLLATLLASVLRKPERS